MKKRSERRKHCALAVKAEPKNFAPPQTPFPGGAGRPKFNQLEMVTIPSPKDQFGEDRCMQFNNNHYHKIKQFVTRTKSMDKTMNRRLNCSMRRQHDSKVLDNCKETSFAVLNAF